MRVLKKRSFAWCVLAVCVLLSLSLSGGGALREYRNETLEIFVMGINGDGLSIDNDLRARADAAIALADAADALTIESAGAVRQAAENLAAADTIRLKYTANEALTSAVQALETEMKSAGLADSQRESLARHGVELRSRADTISRDVYNDKAAQFNSSLSAFPASFIAMISGVSPVELFE